MKALLSTTPAFGHWLPLVPLGRALQAQGDDVAVVTGEVLRPAVEPEGFTLLPAGPGPEEILLEVTRRTGEDAANNPTPASVAEFFGAARPDLTADEAIAAGREFGAELLVHEATDFVGPLVAAALGIPSVALAFGPEVPPEFTAAMVTAVASRYTERGLPAPTATPSGRLLLDTCPPLLQFDTVSHDVERVGLRPEPHRASADAPLPIAAEPTLSRPKVLCSFGTVFTDVAVLQPILAALTELDIDLVVTLGLTAKPEHFTIDASRVEFTPFVPLAELLDGVSAVVSHGGAGTTLGTLATGIPMVVIPQGADQFLQADRVSTAGAGLALPPGQSGPEAVAEALTRVLSEPSFRNRAEEIRIQTSTMPSAAEVATYLRKLS
ncbi:glycosyltransferase [Cryptosporangium sp. NPDC048952]|uniref:glycosyltransferase n=1 Tax=Cryptosporangium sp. NPDC048952 TaxID=3363961 RepID=UPI003721C71F